MEAGGAGRFYVRIVFRPRPDGRIPVMAGPRIIEIADPQRVRRLLEGCNVKVVRRPKTGAIVELQVLQHGDDSRTPSRWANPQRLSHNHETPTNVQGVWALKKLAAVAQGPDEA